MSERTEKMGSLLASLAARFLEQEANPNPLITVTRASVSPDGKRVIVYLSVFPTEKETNAVEFASRKAVEFRKYVAENARLRATPFITFELDRGERNRQRLDELSQ